MPIFDPRCAECKRQTATCDRHSYAVKCKTCGRYLYDPFYEPNLGELPRPHHKEGERCASEVPDFDGTKPGPVDSTEKGRAMSFWERIFGKSDRVTLSLEMSPEIKERIRKVQEVSEKGVGRVVSGGLAYYEAAARAEARGAKVVCREPNGTETEWPFK